MKISFEKTSKEEKKAKRLEKEELERETARTVVPLFIEKAKVKLGVAAFACFLLAILNEFVLNNMSNSFITMGYVLIAIITYAVTRKEWKAAKIESEQ